MGTIVPCGPARGGSLWLGWRGRFPLLHCCRNAFAIAKLSGRRLDFHAGWKPFAVVGATTVAGQLIGLSYGTPLIGTAMAAICVASIPLFSMVISQLWGLNALLRAASSACCSASPASCYWSASRRLPSRLPSSWAVSPCFSPVFCGFRQQLCQPPPIRHRLMGNHYRRIRLWRYSDLATDLRSSRANHAGAD